MKKPLLLLVLFSTALMAHSQGRAEAAVIKCVQAVHRAVFVDKDSLALEKLFAPEITYGHSHGNLQNRKMAIEGASHNTSTYANIQQKDITVIVYGKTAVSRYLLTGTETSRDGKVTELNLNILQAWSKKKHHWKMVGRQAVKVS